MIVESDLLGAIEIPPEEIIFFPGGLFGFPESRSFALLPAAREGMYWLQSIDHGSLVFLLTDPFLAFEGYAVDLSVADRTDVRAESPDQVAILAIVTLPRTRHERPTANLQGPLAINLAARRAKQLALPESDYGIRCPIDLDETR